MAVPLTMILLSGGVLCVLIALFRYERTHQMRFLHYPRAMVDRTLEDAKLRVGQKYREVTAHTIRQSVHYIFHQILTALLHKLQRLEGSMYSIVRFNKNRAKRRTASVTPHFSVIADHKRSTRLSPAEMQKKRDEALMGR